MVMERGSEFVEIVAMDDRTGKAVPLGEVVRGVFKGLVSPADFSLQLRKTAGPVVIGSSRKAPMSALPLVNPAAEWFHDQTGNHV